MYEIFIKDIQLPIAPAKIQQKIPSRNKTLNLINEGEVSILKKQGLKDITFKILLPNVEYNFAQYTNNNFENADWYLKLFKSLKAEKEVFQLKINRVFPNGEVIYDDDVKVTLEDYSVTDDASEGFDAVVDLKFKEYKPFITKKCVILTSDDETKLEVSLQNVRETSSSPEPQKTPKKYTVVSGDTLWKIAKSFYGNGSKYTTIATANSISNPNVIKVGQVLTIPVL